MWLHLGMAECHVSVLGPRPNFYNNRVRAYLIYMYYLRDESKDFCMDTSLDADVLHTIFRSL